MKLSDGFSNPGAWPNRDPAQFMLGSGVSPIAIHPDAGRPPRQIQWSIGIQALVKGNVTVDIAYVGSRGSRWESNGLSNLNALSYERLESFGLDIGSADDEDTSDDSKEAADRLLLRSTLNSALARQRGVFHAALRIVSSHADGRSVAEAVPAVWRYFLSMGSAGQDLV
jgi:hypothetical protein